MSKKNRYSSPQPGGPLISNDLLDNTDSGTEKPEKKSSRSRSRSPKTETDDSDSGRRSFMKTTVAAGIGVVALGAPLCGGVRMTLAPVSQQGQAGKFYPLASLDALTDVPEKFAIVDDRKDAWMVSPKQRLGTVYLRRVGDTVTALHSVCPHAACQILYGKVKPPKGEQEEPLFYCPCHAAHFTLDGKRLDQVSPRDMDELEVKIENGTVFVRYENYVVGIAEKSVMA